MTDYKPLVLNESSGRLAELPDEDTLIASRIESPSGPLTLVPESGSDLDISLGQDASVHVTSASLGNDGDATVLILSHSAMGTPAEVGFGMSVFYRLSDEDDDAHDAGYTNILWVDAGHTTHRARQNFAVNDADAARTCITIEATGSAGAIGFLGASASARLSSPDAGSALVTFGLASGTPTFAIANVSGMGTGVGAFLATPSSANLASAVTDETGSGSLVFANSPTLVTPALGTPSSGTLTNCTGLPVASGISGLGSGVATWLATPSSANLASAVTDESGSGALIFGTSPTMTNATINQAANGNTALSMARATNTSPTGKFLSCTDSTGATNVFSIDRFGAVAANITAQTGVNESVFDFTISDSGTVFSLANGTATDGLFNPSFFGTTAQGSEGVPVSFIGTKGVDTTTNPALLFFYRHNTGSGNADLSANVTGVEFRNRVTKAFGITGGHNVQLAGGTTSPTVAGATADIVSLCGFDRINTRHAAAGNRLLAVQSERGSAIYLGDDALDFAASTALLSVGGTDIATLTTTSMTLADAFNIAVNTSTGTKIGTATTQKLGFYNATPIVQRSGAAQAAVATTAATQTTPWGFSTQAQADAIVTLVNELRAWAVAQGFIKGSA